MTRRELNRRRKEERKRQLIFDIIIIIVILLSFAFGFFGSMMIDKSYASEVIEIPDLWVGASQEDFSYSVIIEEEVTEEVAEPVEEEFVMAYPDEDLELFAKILYLEAGSQSEECIEMVGNVILNRIESDYWNFKYQHTIEEVVSAKGQYTTYQKALRIDADDVPDLIYEIADFLLAYGSQDTIPLYQHYKRAVKGTTFYMQIGTEVFSY